MSKTITLTRGYQAVVDDEDWEAISRWKWHTTGTGRAGFYAGRSVRVRGGKRKTLSVYMHAQVMDLPIGARQAWGLEVDHINGNTLDNRKSNLRIVTRAQNGKNRKMHSTNTSGITGVSHLETGRWLGHITVGGKPMARTFRTKEEAVRWRKKAEVKYFGEFRRDERALEAPTVKQSKERS